VPLDAYEEDQFRRITARLREEEADLARRGRWRRAWDAVGPLGAAALLVVALATLPLALVSELYPLGLVGYLVATLATAKLATHYLPRLLHRSRTRTTGGDDPTDGPRVNRTGMLWGAIVGAAALAMVVTLAPGGAPDRSPATGTQTEAPAASSPGSFTDAREAPAEQPSADATDRASS
jgi:membrane protease YdiL (CAAX protease family)